jgi:pSer/pThr/pTyr-binding forkhead associated (FHA) protein
MQATAKFSKTVSGTIRSLAGGSGRKYFIIEHKTQSNRHKIGESVEYMGDYVEIGRGSQYALAFGDDCQTVSRPHAAIERTDQGWVIKHLSLVNPTLVNGQELSNTPRALSNGDEIQLSHKGPVFSFLTPQGNTVKNMGMTVRLKAMGRELVRPYKYAMSGLLILLVAGCVMSWRIIHGKDVEIVEKDKVITEVREELAKTKQISDDRVDEIKALNAKNMAGTRQVALYKNQLLNAIENRPKPSVSTPENTTKNTEIAQPTTPETAKVQNLFQGVYYLTMDSIVLEGNGLSTSFPVGGSGSGFLLSDGRFITARHCIEPWSYYAADDETMLLLNYTVNNLDCKITHYLTATSSNGTKIRLTNHDFKWTNKNDKKYEATIEGQPALLTQVNLPDSEDWASAKLSKMPSGGLSFDASESSQLVVSSKVFALGFPHGIGAEDSKPLYSEMTVARDGLHNGRIEISGRSFDKGNSGGPVFVEKNGKFEVIGIVSSMAGQQGFIVPIATAR